MGKLTCLQTLTDFVVGNDPCFKVKELGPLLYLQETLHISRLENVIQPGDARDANLIPKVELGGLLLEWSPNLDEPQDRTIDLEVLNALQPHRVLKELIIRCYGGTEFPTWLRAPSFPNMVLLRIEDCKECILLPPVGQLPSLKVLSIKGMAKVKNIGSEFNGEGLSPPLDRWRLCILRIWRNGRTGFLMRDSHSYKSFLFKVVPSFLGNYQTYILY
jgi:hypothetical protein